MGFNVSKWKSSLFMKTHENHQLCRIESIPVTVSRYPLYEYTNFFYPFLWVVWYLSFIFLICASLKCWQGCVRKWVCLKKTTFCVAGIGILHFQWLAWDGWEGEVSFESILVWTLFFKLGWLLNRHFVALEGLEKCLLVCFLSCSDRSSSPILINVFIVLL